MGDPQLLRQLPRIDGLLADPALAAARLRVGDVVLARLSRSAVSAARERALEGEAPERGAILQAIVAAVERMLSQRLRRVINATGVVLHTNLGRAPLSSHVAISLAEHCAGYATVELALSTGRRGPRGGLVEEALCHLTGAEAALVVNNNAAAVLLVLTALTRGRRVVVSRGELIEIGGGFRIPEVLERSGAHMVEVGTTNKTRLSDYERALEAEGEVAAILRVHPSNFRQLGFVARPERAQLAELARARGVVLIEDLGGGALLDMSAAGLDEPVVSSVVAAGAEIICFSCDKALGGPQGGAIVGRAELVERVRRDPLARALRLGRLPMAALEATLMHYLAGDHEAVPAVAMIRTPMDALRERVARWQATLRARGVAADMLEVEGIVGGGTASDEPLPSVALALEGDAEALAAALRGGEPPVLARIRRGRLLIDGRTVLPSEEEALLRRLREATSSSGDKISSV